MFCHRRRCRRRCRDGDAEDKSARYFDYMIYLIGSDSFACVRIENKLLIKYGRTKKGAIEKKKSAVKGESTQVE